MHRPLVPRIHAKSTKTQRKRVTEKEHSARSRVSRSHSAVIRVYDAAGNVIETHGQAGGSRESQFRHKNVTCVSLNFSALERYEKTFHAPGASRGTKKVGVCFARW